MAVSAYHVVDVVVAFFFSNKPDKNKTWPKSSHLDLTPSAMLLQEITLNQRTHKTNNLVM